MDATDTVMDDPLPAPTGPKAMAMFLEQAQAQGGAAPPAVAAGDGQRSAVSPKLAEAVQAPAQHAATAAGSQQQHTPMTRLEKEACVAMHGILAKYKEADPFRQPVDVEALNIPDYYDVIKTPMDLKTVREKLRADKYKTVQEWRADLQLIWDNARKYNGDEHPVTKHAQKLAAALEQRWEDALTVARANLQAADRGEPRVRKASKPRVVLPGSSDADSESQDEALPRPTRSAHGPGGSTPQQRSPDSKAIGIKREAPEPAGANRGGKKRVSGLPPAGGSNQALDLDSLSAMLNTPMARQLGAEEPDDLAFLALWKRLMTRKQQLAAAAQDIEPLRNSNNQLRKSLAVAQDTIAQLQDKLRDEGAARAAAVAAKEAAQEKLAELQQELDRVQVDRAQQKGLLEHQKALLEQQQDLLRKLALKQRQEAKPSTPAASVQSGAAAQ